MSTSSSSSSYDKVAKAESAKVDPFAEQRAGYRAYNNYFKAAQIRFAVSHYNKNNCAPHGISFLDLASGRGGDLAKVLNMNKAQTVPVTVYAALDISNESVAEAKRRYAKMTENPKFLSSFILNNKSLPQTLFDVADVFDTDKTWTTHMALTTRKFEIVNIQFALHYCCSSIEKLRGFLQCVSNILVKDGFFMGTTVDSESLKKKVLKQEKQQNSKDENENVCTNNNNNNNSHFKVVLQNPEKADLAKFTDASVPLPIGLSYRFQLPELVDDVEYSIPWKMLKDEAEKVGLVAVESQCGNLYDDRFKVGYVPSEDNKVRPVLDDNDVELISFYLGFVFQKI